VTGKDLQKIRRMMMLTVEELAVKVKRSRRTIEQYECGRRRVPADVELFLTGICPTCGTRKELRKP